ncbi:hypothetical protein CsSME_00015045 [Camellia sinensis var. sinensis]
MELLVLDKIHEGFNGVTWDEPEVLQNVKRVNPWQVEYVVPTPPIHSTYPPAKKLRFSQNSVLPTDGEGDLFFPITGLNNSMIRNLNPSLMNYNSFPAGMQGARQDPFCVSSLSNFTSENNHHMCGDKLVGNNMTPKLKTVSTELNIGSSQTDNLSPDSQSSVHFFGNDLVGKQGCNSSTKVSLGSFQLFGKIIHTKDPVENGFDDAGCTEDKGCKMFKEADDLKQNMNALHLINLKFGSCLDHRFE